MSDCRRLCAVCGFRYNALARHLRWSRHIAARTKAEGKGVYIVKSEKGIPLWQRAWEPRVGIEGWKRAGGRVG